MHEKLKDLIESHTGIGIDGVEKFIRIAEKQIKETKAYKEIDPDGENTHKQLSDATYELELLAHTLLSMGAKIDMSAQELRVAERLTYADQRCKDEDHINENRNAAAKAGEDAAYQCVAYWFDFPTLQMCEEHLQSKIFTYAWYLKRVSCRNGLYLIAQKAMRETVKKLEGARSNCDATHATK